MTHTMQPPPQPQPTGPPGGGAVAPGDARHRADGATLVPSAKVPVSSTGLTVLGLFWALVLVALGVVALHDALVAAGALNQSGWIPPVVDTVGGLRPDARLLVVATLVGLVGLVLLWCALRPRRRRGLAVGAAAGTFLRHRQLSRLVTSRVATLDGVLSARASTRRRTVHVRLRAVEGIDSDDLGTRAHDLITSDLAVLAKPARARVAVQERHL